MALVDQKLKKKFEATLISAFKREFAKEFEADPSSHKRMVAAISDLAIDIVLALTTEAKVLPGQAVATVGSPTAQAGATTSPGSIS